VAPLFTATDPTRRSALARRAVIRQSVRMRWVVLVAFLPAVGYGLLNLLTPRGNDCLAKAFDREAREGRPSGSCRERVSTMGSR
jgi:hypothetical protein